MSAIKPKEQDSFSASGPFPGELYRRYTIEELARMQGVKPVEDFEALLGGWPAEEIDDQFEAAVAQWRRNDPKAEGRLDPGRR